MFSNSVNILNIVRHERAFYKVCVTAQKKRVWPLVPDLQELATMLFAGFNET
jgi:hypothetical protein